MAEYIKALATSEIPEGKAKKFTHNELDVALICRDGKFYAINDICTHAEESLSDGGEVEGCEIECPIHFARFNFMTGAVTEPPAFEDIKTYPTKVEDGFVWIEI